MPAKKNDDEQINMIGSFREFQDTKHIDRTTLVSVLEESFRNVLAKIFGSDENFDVIVNPDKGDFEIYRNRIVVANGDVADENKEISLADAQKIDADYEVGEEVMLQELNGYHRFIGNDRVDKQGKKELLWGVVPMLVVIAICAVLTFVVS